ncbi:MAG: nucleoside deaminase [Candidatus Gastranaerophilales bacterium]|nr:nucleoside deaminase [Candidatus Gastranaerophilales bacterium]
MQFMNLAIEEAKKADGDIPVGAVIVKDGEVIASAFNTREKDKDITSHAEILAIRMAEKYLGNWRLDGCELYVTLEPCPMCGWAILQSRIKTVYFGSYDTNYGAFSSKIDLRSLMSGTKLNVYGGILEAECDLILNDFFKTLR